MLALVFLGEGDRSANFGKKIKLGTTELVDLKIESKIE
jgi:hypothetical protein